MPLIHDDALVCPECGYNLFRPEELVMLHKQVRERFYVSEKEHPLPYMQKVILYRCAKCGFTLDK